MKSIKNLIIKGHLQRILRINFFAFILIVFISCNEKELLEEIPLDFYSPVTSFVTYEDFESGLVNLYSRARTDFWGIDVNSGSDGNAWNCPRVTWSGTDLIYSDKVLGFSPNYQGYIIPSNSIMIEASVWDPAYRIIYDANVIIGRADGESSRLTDQEKIIVKAEAKLFRAYCYRMLAHLYGGVPIVLEETTSPKRDYVRATRSEVYELCVSDLKFAAENLPDIDEADDSRVNKLVAYHLLSEVYICLNRWQEAIDAATVVINHPGMALMTERFGTRKNDPDFGGDVYWDLFRKGNQNRSTGNTEAIWVAQCEFQTPGGGDGGTLLEQVLVPRLWQATIKNTNGKLIPLIPQPNTFYYGVGRGYIRPSNYFFWTVWQKSGYYQDIRNSKYNIVRDFKIDNPASDFNGKWVIKDKLPLSYKTQNDTLRNFFPVVAKCSDPGKHPLELYLADQTVLGSLVPQANFVYKDEYVIRLAETYLLRAEAYLGNNNKLNAAKDINVVRRRALAADVSSSEVDIDYILDERMRELNFEELRLLTLCRLGKYVERTKTCNPSVGATLMEKNNLWPIPFSEIEKNIEAVLEQNPGY